MADYDWDERRERKLQMQEVGRGNKGRKREFKKRGSRPQSKRIVESVKKEAVAVAGKFSIALKENDVASTKNYISEIFSNKTVPQNPSLFWSLVTKKKLFSLAGHRQKYVAMLALALGVWEYMASNDVFDRHLILLAEYAKAPSLLKKTTPIRLLLFVLFDYVHNDTETGEPKLDVKRLSRDALVLEWLIESKVRSFKVLEYQSENGGGVDRWYMMKRDGVSAVQYAHKRDEQKHDAALRKADRKTQKSLSDLVDIDEADRKPFNWADILNPELESFVRKNYKMQNGEKLVLKFEMNSSLKLTYERKYGAGVRCHVPPVFRFKKAAHKVVH